MAFIKSYKGQNWLLPPNIEDMIPKDHICYLVETVIAMVDFTEIEIKYSGPGHPAYHPSICCKIWIQAMLDKLRSSRKVARQPRENVVYIYLAEKLTPDFRTLSDFRKQNSKLLKDLFKLTVRIAKELGAIDLDHLSTDGSKLKACASNRSGVTKEELDVIEQYVNNELEKGIEIDKLEDEHFKECRGYDQLKASSKKKIKSLIGKYIKQMKKDKHGFRLFGIKENITEAKTELESNELNKVSLTDKESRYMKSKKGNFELSYNPQITTDNKLGIIIANDVCQDKNDINQLQPQIELVEQNVGKLKPDTKLSLDNGYHSGENINFLNSKHLDGYIPNQDQAQKAKGKKISKNKYDVSNFFYNDINDEFICPQKNRLKFNYDYYDKTKKKKIRIYKGINCLNCPSNSQCTKRKDKIRRIKCYPFLKQRREMAKKMQMKTSRKIFSRRKETVEIPFGHIKENLGFRSFLTKGIDTVKTEFNLACIAYNLTRLWKFISENNINLNKIIKTFLIKNNLNSIKLKFNLSSC